MNKYYKFFLKAVTILFLITHFTATVNAGEHFIGQKDKKFSQKNITIKSGDTVVFTNQDAIFHNIHSLTLSDSFDLGSFKQGETRKHTFSATGVHEVECAIHPFMFLTVIVE